MKRIAALSLSLALALLLLAGCGRACNSENAAIPGETASSGETGSAPGGAEAGVEGETGEAGENEENAGDTLRPGTQVDPDPGEGNGPGPIVLPVEPDYPASAGGEGAEPEDTTRMVMVDGVLYADTGRPSSVTARCGTMDGEITSTVETGQVPSQDDQSNFGADYGYQFGFEEGTIEVCIGQEWVVFAPAE